MYKEDQVMAKRVLPKLKHVKSNFEKCKHKDFKRYTLCTLHPKSATDWADG
jgi:hypothetical protein